MAKKEAPKTDKGLESKLQPHQLRTLEKLDNSSGVLAQHSLGSGKTLTALAAISRLHERDPKAKAIFIAPASLVSNIDKEIDKHKVKIDRKRLATSSYEKAVNDVEKHLDEGYDLAVVDEAHKLRNTSTKRFSQINKILANSKKRLGLTGTPIYNQVHDIGPVLNSIAGHKVLDVDPAAFEKEHLARIKVSPGFFAEHVMGVPPGEKVVLKNPEKLKKAIKPYVDFYDAADNNPKDFARRKDKIIKVEMSPEQHQYYKYVEGDVPFHIRWKIRSGVPLNKQETSQLNAFSTGVRQVANTHAPYTVHKEKDDLMTPKILTAVNSLHERHKKDKNFRGVVYSNYLEAGLRQYSKELTKRKIPHIVFTGELSKKEKDKAVEDYNSGKARVLLLSSSGAEGLNLQGTRLMQVMEPHFNKSKIEQVIGRGIRYKSHEHLPESDREVDVEHYVSTFPKGMFGPSKDKTIDEYLYANSEEKEKLKNEIKNLVKTAMILSRIRNTMV